LPLTLLIVGAAAVVGDAAGETHTARSSGSSGFGKSGERGQSPQDQDQALSAMAPAKDGNAYTPRRTEENARIGAVFEKDDQGAHFCTASVVQSPGRNMLITAAHCAFDADSGQPLNDLVFAPGYRNGDEPTGLWKVSKVVVDDRWAKSQEEDLDVAFLVLDQKDGKDIQDVLGGNALGVNRGFDNKVKITGYPTSRDTPISCQNRTTKFSDTQLRIQPLRGLVPRAPMTACAASPTSSASLSTCRVHCSSGASPFSVSRQLNVSARHRIVSQSSVAAPHLC
jgi:Trypsin